MYDAKITADGTLDLASGDIEGVGFDRFVSQKIYRAIMNMPSDLVAGVDESKPDDITSALLSYLYDYFSVDSDVNPSGFSIEISGRSNQSISFSVSYKGDSPDGTTVADSRGFGFGVVGGAITSIDYEPPWLELRENAEEIPISMGITISELVTDIEIPIEPVPSEYATGQKYSYATPETASSLASIGNTEINNTESALPQDEYGDVIPENTGSIRNSLDAIVLCTQGIEEEADEVLEVPFVIETDYRSVYPISRYAEGYIEGEHVLIGATVTAVSGSLKFSRRREDGEELLLLHSGSGEIRGTAYMVRAKYVTYTYEIRNSKVGPGVYKLAPIRGNFYAIFDKSVKKGDYVLKYKAYREVS